MHMIWKVINKLFTKKKVSIIFFVISTIIFMIITDFQGIVFSAPGNTADENNSIKDDISKYKEYEEISENSKYALFFNPNTGGIIVKNKKTEYLWKSIIDYPEDYKLEELNDYWMNYISSLFIINYTDLEKNMGVEEKAFSRTDAKIIKFNNMNNGFSLDYSFEKIGIDITVEITLHEDSMTISIPGSKIYENSKYGIVTIEVMPFLGATGEDTDGYIFFPDGCGAIMKYNRAINRPDFVQPYKGFIFSPERVDISYYNEMEEMQKYNAMLPIYGIKNGENALLAIVTKCEEETAINVYPYGFSVNLNRAGFEFYYRHYYPIILSNIKINGKNVAKNLTSVSADKEPILEDHEICFTFLDGKDACYSGMASKYKEYLIKNDQIQKKLINEGNIPISVRLIMGIKEERMIFDKYIPMTTFMEAKTIAEELQNNGVKDLQLNLAGWTKSGYGAYPDDWSSNRKLGGFSGMKELLEYAQKNNIKMFLQENSINAIASSKNFSKRNEIIMQGNDLPVTDFDNKNFILNPSAVYKRIKNLINNIPIDTGTGICMEKIGEMIYCDYNKNNPSNRTSTLKTWKDILLLAERMQIPIGAEGGNAYILKYADYLFDIPIKSSGYHVADEEVPFFQMVVHGRIPYTSEPGNLSYDLDKQKLKWIEYGCMPFFILTHQDTIKLKNTNYNKLFNSQYESWINVLVDIYNEFNERLKETWTSEIVEHTRIDEDLVKIKYSNDLIVYINYDNNERYCEGYLIKGEDYLVVDGKGGAR